MKKDYKVNDMVINELQNACLTELAKVGWVFLGDAGETIPYDTWDMRNSGTVTSDQTSQSVYVSYDTPYAVRQHEETSYNHKPGRRARWLELTAVENQTKYEQLFVRLLQQKMNSLGGGR